MSDLTFLDNGNPNFHDDGLINFSKCRLIYNQIIDLVLRQVSSVRVCVGGGLTDDTWNLGVQLSRFTQ